MGHTVGLVTSALAAENFPRDCWAFASGPPPMLKAVVGLLRQHLPVERIWISEARVDAQNRVLGPVFGVSG